MKQRPTARVRAAAIVALTALAGCGPPPRENMIFEGTPDSVTIRYGGDPAGTLPLARKHCAQFERIPARRDVDETYIRYACVVP